MNTKLIGLVSTTPALVLAAPREREGRIALSRKFRLRSLATAGAALAAICSSLLIGTPAQAEGWWTGGNAYNLIANLNPGTYFLTWDVHFQSCHWYCFDAVAYYGKCESAKYPTTLLVAKARRDFTADGWDIVAPTGGAIVQYADPEDCPPDYGDEVGVIPTP